MVSSICCIHYIFNLHGRGYALAKMLFFNQCRVAVSHRSAGKNLVAGRQIFMQKRISTLPFKGTAEQKSKLDAVIAEHKSQPGAVMPVLQKAQDIYGYLPIEVQEMIADGLGVSLEKVYGVSTFYSQFALSPKGKYNISVCLGTACYVKGSGALLDKLVEELKIQPEECTSDGQFSLTACRCIGACGLAPVLTVNDDVYGRLLPKDIPDIIAKYRQ